MERLGSLLPVNPGGMARWADHRMTINGVFWRARTSSLRRDVPADYDPWQTVYERHDPWSKDGTLPSKSSLLVSCCSFNTWSAPWQWR